MHTYAVVAFLLRFDCSRGLSHHQVVANVGKTTDEKVDSVIVKPDMLTM